MEGGVVGGLAHLRCRHTGTARRQQAAQVLRMHWKFRCCCVSAQPAAQGQHACDQTRWQCLGGCPHHRCSYSTMSTTLPTLPLKSG